MSESSKTDTTIEGNVTGPALTGSFSGPVTTDDRSQTQSVTVNVQGAIDLNIPEPPLKEQIKSMWKMMLLDQAERRERQNLADERYQEAKEHRETVNAQLDVHTLKLDDVGDSIVELTKQTTQNTQQTAANARRVSRLEIILAVVVALSIVAGFLLMGVAMWLLSR